MLLRATVPRLTERMVLNLYHMSFTSYLCVLSKGFLVEFLEVALVRLVMAICL